MSETGNIEELAKIISDDIFKWFKWEKRPIKDTDWTCVTKHHNKKTHPTDVVFHYDDPYTGSTIYLNTDLKSYKKSSITTASIEKALKSLSIAIECANVSDDWQQKFILDNTMYDRVIGLLFIYNHDNEFDKELKELIKTVDLKKINIEEFTKLIIFDPTRIQYLLNVVTDIKNLTADDKLPKRKDYTFFYPDLILSKRHGEEWNQPASIESLTAPWMIIKHKACEEISEGYLVYYDRRGDTVEEFIYLIDALSHYQMLLSNTPIRIRFTNSVPEAKNNLDKAKHEYLKTWGADEARERQLNQITANSITKVVSNYCPMEIGMRENDH